MIQRTMITEAIIRANDGSMRLVPYTGNSVVCHNRLISTYRSRIGKYRRRGVRIFDEIEVDLEVLNTRATFNNDGNPLGGLLYKIQELWPFIVWWT